MSHVHSWSWSIRLMSLCACLATMSLMYSTKIYACFHDVKFLVEGFHTVSHILEVEIQIRLKETRIKSYVIFFWPWFSIDGIFNYLFWHSHMPQEKFFLGFPYLPRKYSYRYKSQNVLALDNFIGFSIVFACGFYQRVWGCLYLSHNMVKIE